MLHHVPSVGLQDALLSEVARVLKPGGVFVAADSLDSPGFHEGDTCNPVDAEGLAGRLRAAGFDDVRVTGEWTSPAGEDEVYGSVFIVAHTAAG